MRKEELLYELSQMVTSGEISKDEVLTTLSLGSEEQKGQAGAGIFKKHFSVAKMLYSIGAIIVAIGLIIFVGQIWDDIGAFGHILVTFILGLVITGFGVMMFRNEEERKKMLGEIYLTIGGLLVPGGAVVITNEILDKPTTLWPFVFAFLGVFLFYLILSLNIKSVAVSFYTIGNATIVIYLTVAAMLQKQHLAYEDEIYAYLTIVIGVMYILLGRTFKGKYNERLVGVLFFFGSGAILGAAFSQIFDSGFWQLLYIFVLLGGFLLSVHERSRIFLVMSTIFVIAYLSYITGEYFANSLGWPISLVILGLVFIGLGYTSISINKKFISGPKQTEE